jgi:predicted transcriptional regulator of viral defense system
MDIASKNNQVRLSDYVEALLKKGSICFTKAEAVKALGTTEIAFMRAAQRYQKKGMLLRPVTGFYVVIEVEHRDAGGPPVIHFINKLMKYLKLPYYIGMLSAARFHGATHQAVMETQVLTLRPLPMIKYGRHRIRFITNKFTEKIPKQTLETPHGSVLISTPEATLFDLVRYHKKAVGFSHIATVILEMKDKINGKKLPPVAQVYNDIPIAQRVGFLLDTYGNKKSAIPLQDWLTDKDVPLVKLNPMSSSKGDQNIKWSINVNTTIEPDLI